MEPEKDARSNTPLLLGTQTPKIKSVPLLPFVIPRISHSELAPQIFLTMVERSVLIGLAVAAIVAVVVVEGDSSVKTLVKTVKGKKVCDKGWECKGWSEFCCNLTISDYFQTYQFENLFSKRNSPVAHAVGFWDYRSFILASAVYQPLGFGTTGGKVMQMKELAAFLGHVGCKTSCKWLIWCLAAEKIEGK